MVIDHFGVSIAPLNHMRTPKGEQIRHITIDWLQRIGLRRQILKEFAAADNARDHSEKYSMLL